MFDEEKEELEETTIIVVDKPSKKSSKATMVNVTRLNSGRGGIVRLRSNENGEIRFFSTMDVDMNLKVYNISEELWKKGNK